MTLDHSLDDACSSKDILARHTGETIKSANCLEQTCSKKIWRRGGGARIAEQQADLHGIIRSHRTSVHIRRLVSAFQTFLAFLPVGVPFQAAIGVGRRVGVVLVKTSFAAGVTRLR
jgi:hypothetical protein